MPPGAVSAAVEPVTTIEPPRPAAIIGGTVARSVFQAPVRLTSITSRHSSSVISQGGRLCGAMAAFAETTSRCPKAARHSSTTALELAEIGGRPPCVR